MEVWPALRWVSITFIGLLSFAQAVLRLIRHHHRFPTLAFMTRFIDNPVRVLWECRRVLKPGGLVCLSELLSDPDYPLRGTEKRWAEEAGLELKSMGTYSPTSSTSVSNK
jgi:ubiquinone/menaquinone biosynthesis C-methylase UbiE